MTECRFIGPVVNRLELDGQHLCDIRRCDLFSQCTVADHGRTKGGQPIAVCDTCERKEFGQKPDTTDGVGSEVSAILSSLGIAAESCGGCREMIRRMNAWGVEGCREHRDEILARLREKTAESAWGLKLKAAAIALVNGLAFKLDWLDPSPGILDEAIRRFESRSNAVAVAVASPTDHVAVVIPSHNYGRFLDECLQSVQGQRATPAEIIVVDDASDEGDEAAAICERRGVRYLRVDFRNVYLTRRAGLEATTSPFVVFLDADDMIAPPYLMECLAVMKSDEAIGIVTSDLQAFGSRSQRIHHAGRNIEAANWIHAGSMVRRIALTTSAAYERPIPPEQSHADWYAWRHVIRAGWKVGRIPTASYLYRQHDQSMMAVRGAGWPYYEEASLACEPITLVLPLSGRARYWPRLREWAEAQRRVTDLLVIDTSSDVDFRRNVRRWLADLPVDSTKYVSLGSSNGLADSDRRIGGTVNQAYRAVQRMMPRIYRHLRESVTTEFVMIVEDDVLPPEDAIERLLHSMGINIAAVSGHVPSRWNLTASISWDRDQRTIPLEQNSGGVVDVGGTGFGCLLLRRSAMLQAPPFHNGGKTQNYDVEFSRAVRQAGWRWLLDWSVSCGHGDIPRPNGLPLMSLSGSPIHKAEQDA